MQALSVWPLKGCCLPVPHVEFVLGSSCNSRTRRKRTRIWDLDSQFACNRSPHFLFVSNNSRKFDLQSGVFSNHSKLNFVMVCEPKRCSFSASFALTWALEHEAIASEFSEEITKPTDGAPAEMVTEEVNGISINEVVGNEEKENARIRSELGGGSSARVDVRELASSLSFAKTPADVEKVLGDMTDLPLPVYSSMIRGFGMDKKLESAFVLYEWLKMKRTKTNGSIGPNLFIYNSLLGAMKQCKQFEEVDKVLGDMAKDGIVPNIVTYNALMAIYLEQGRGKEALNFLEEIQQKGLSPSPVTYSTALLAYRRMEDGNGALRFFVELREKYQKGGIGKDLGEDWENEFIKLENFTIRICFQVMRRWLVKQENLSTKVLKLLIDMDKAGLKAGRVEHERLVWACTQEGHYIVAKELYKRIREKELEISLSVCNHVIWVLGKAKKWWAALEIYEELLDKGPKPNNLSYELIVSHFNILLTAAKKRGIWRWGVRLLNKMEEKGLNPGSREWNAVLVACSKAAETSAAVQIFRRMVEHGEKPTVLSYGALLSALEKGKLYDEALRVWDHMIKVGVKPNLYAYTILASVHAGQGNSEMIESVVKEMSDSGIEPTVVTYNAIISGCARNGMGTTAFEWFHCLKATNVSPNEITYEMLIEALVKDGKPRLAYELYLRAQNEGLRLASKAYDAVVLSAQVYGATIDVSSLGTRPPEKKKSVKPRKNLLEFCNLADVPRRSKPFDKEEVYAQNIQGKQ